MQMEEEIYDVLDGKEGSFEVNPAGTVDMGESDPVLLSFDVMSILMEEARRMDEWQSIRQNISSLDDIFIKTGSFDPEAADLTTLQKTLGKYVDGTYSVRGLIGKLMLPRFEILSALNCFYFN